MPTKHKKVIDISSHPKTKNMSAGPAKAVCTICRDGIEKQGRPVEKSGRKLKDYLKTHPVTGDAVISDETLTGESFQLEKQAIDKLHGEFKSKFNDLLISYLKIERLFDKNFEPESILPTQQLDDKATLIKKYGQQ